MNATERAIYAVIQLWRLGECRQILKEVTNGN